MGNCDLDTPLCLIKQFNLKSSSEFVHIQNTHVYQISKMNNTNLSSGVNIHITKSIIKNALIQVLVFSGSLKKIMLLAEMSAGCKMGQAQHSIKGHNSAKNVFISHQIQGVSE